MNENLWAISTIENNKKLYITCLQFSYSLVLQFPYDIINLPNRCEANAITFILPSNNWFNIDSSIKAWENKFGFNRSYSKILNFSLIQFQNISSLHDHELQLIATEIPDIKYFFIISMNNTLTTLHSILITHWSAHVVTIIPAILTPITIIITVISISISILILYCKCWQNKYSSVPKCTRPEDPPTPCNDINLMPILASVQSQPQQMTPQIIQESLKSYDVDFNWML